MIKRYIAKKKKEKKRLEGTRNRFLEATGAGRILEQTARNQDENWQRD